MINVQLYIVRFEGQNGQNWNDPAVELKIMKTNRKKGGLFNFSDSLAGTKGILPP